MSNYRLQLVATINCNKLEKKRSELLVLRECKRPWIGNEIWLCAKNYYREGENIYIYAGFYQTRVICLLMVLPVMLE